MSKLSTLAFLLAGLLVGCADIPKDPTATWSPNKIYAEAKEEASAGAYDKAITLYEKLEGRAAGTILAQQAQIEKAYAYHKSGEPAQALVTLERFIKLHPSSTALDYALYLKGLVNFNDNLGLLNFIGRQDLSERDQKAAKESFESFKDLVQRFPDSRYAPDSRFRMGYIVNALAQYEVHVAHYYYTRGAYVSAINRAQVALSDYRDVPALEEATYILLKSYEALGMKKLYDDTLRVMQKSYPNSEYLSKGFKPMVDPWYRLW